MSDYKPAPEGKDPLLWETAQKRASFKKHLATYLIVNAFLWAVCLLSSSNYQNFDLNNMNWGNLPWPIFTTLGWGIGLAFHFAGAYVFPGVNSVETEYEKLKNQQKR